MNGVQQAHGNAKLNYRHTSSTSIQFKESEPKFTLSHKLYGRDQELVQLLSSFNQVKEKNVPSKVVFVSGESGSGKTSLVKELHKSISDQCNHFVSGKQDQFKENNIPYSIFLESFKQITTLILAQDAKLISDWGRLLRSTFDDQLGILVELIPDINNILGEPTIGKESMQLGPQESRNQMQNVLTTFVRILAGNGLPLVIFLDDLQWADTHSLKLIENLLSNKMENVFLLGAYRNDERTSATSFVHSLSSKYNVETIVLRCLKEDYVSNLIADSFQLEHTPLVEKFSKIVCCKTNGNPFYLKVFLQKIHREGLVTYDHDKWVFDLDSISRFTSICENVVGLMNRQLQSCEMLEKQLLCIAACMGNSFDYNLLQSVYDVCVNSSLSFQNVLSTVINKKFLVLDELTQSLLRFPHDKVQQACYELYDVHQRSLYHVSIARVMVSNNLVKVKDESLYDILSHFQNGCDLLVNSSENVNIITMCQSASQKSKYCPSLSFSLSSFGVNLLRKTFTEEEIWHNEPLYSIVYELYSQYLSNLVHLKQYDLADKLFLYVEEKVKSEHERIKIKIIRALSYEARSRNKECVHLMVECLSHFDPTISLNSDAIKSRLKSEIALVAQLLGSRSISDLVNSPVTTDKECILQMNVLITMHSNSYIIGYGDLYDLIAVLLLNLNLKYGHCEYSALGYAFYGVVSAQHTGDYQSAYEYSKLAIECASDSWKGRILLYHGVGIMNYFESYQACADTLSEAIIIMNKYCDVTMVQYTQCYLLFVQSLISTNLFDFFDVHRKNLDNLLLQNIYFYEVARFPLLHIERLWTPSLFQGLVESNVNHHNPVGQVTSDKGVMKFATYSLGKLITSFVFEESCESWLKLADDCMEGSNVGLYHLIHEPIAKFYSTLMYLVHDESSTDQLVCADQVIDLFEKLSKNNPLNFEHLLYVLLAQRFVKKQDYKNAQHYFEKAILLADKNNHLLIKLISIELQANLFMARGDFLNYQKSMTIALSVSDLYGSVGKSNLISRKLNLKSLILNNNIPKVLPCLVTSLSKTHQPNKISDIIVVSKKEIDDCCDGKIILLMKWALVFSRADICYYITEKESKYYLYEIKGNGQDHGVREVNNVEELPITKELFYKVVNTKAHHSNVHRIIDENTKSYCCVPVLYENECSGVLVAGVDGVELDESSVDVIRVLANKSLVSMTLEPEI
ncbi:hybrid signal transduction histidine kinase dhkG [Acrasis kona]|uniref:Hybrid signal transduction histidine kinase dhkG n=1 Tax=Acrasis kona TaxID=1008807 RepID=A0AAW2YIA7_9EUKA